MSKRGGHLSGAMLLVVVCVLSQPRPVAAQPDYIQALIGRPRPALRPAFQGHEQLSLALEQADKGDIEGSLKSARAAFADRGAKELFNDLDLQTVGPNLLRLSNLWSAKNAPVDEVAQILRDVVLPIRPAGRIYTFPAQTRLTSDVRALTRQNSRIPAPESVGAELIRWSVAAKQTEELQKRLQIVMKGNPLIEVPRNAKAADGVEKKDLGASTTFDAAAARVVGVQLAIAENDVDRTNSLLKELIDGIERTTDSQLDYVCHAVSSALRNSRSEKTATELLEAVVHRALTLPAESAFQVNAVSLLMRAAELHAQAGRPDDAKRCALAAIAKPQNSQRLGPDYAAFLDHVLKQRAAGVLLDAGAIVESLDIATVAPDPRALRYSQGPSTNNLAARAGRELRKLPPVERYELLRKWALPNGDRTEVRSAIDLVSPELLPHLGSGLLHDVYSTNWELLASAREVGKLDQLIQDVNAIPVQTASVKSLLTLALVMRDGSSGRANDSAPVATKTASSGVPARLTELLAVTTKQVPPWELANKPQPPLDTYVITVEAALHPEWREVAEALMIQLIEHAQRTQAARIRDHFRLALTELIRLRSTGGTATPQLRGELKTSRTDSRESSVYDNWTKLRPKMWEAIGFATSGERELGALSPTWFTHEGYLSHVSNGQESDLCFAVPLTGTFEFNAECREGGWTEGLAGYGGVSCQMYAYTESVYISGKGGAGFAVSPKMTNLLHRSPWNRYTIQVEGDTVRHFANGQLIMEDQPGNSAPWLTLGGKVGFTPTYRNLRITGTPTIPRELALLGDARLRGWVASYFGESKQDALPARRFIQVKVTQNKRDSLMTVEDDGTMQGEPVAANQTQTDWTLVDGELRSARRSSFWPDDAASWLSYQRPMRNGETLRYEFFHVPTKTIAHPTFGDVVYLLGEDGRIETGNVGSDWSRLDGRLATKTLNGSGTAITGGWNAVTLSLRGGKLTIELNNKQIASEEVSTTSSRRFGFYHDAARSDLRVRKVVLTGDWPKSFEEVRAAIEMPTPTEPLPDSRFLTHVIGESYFSDNACEIYRRAITLETSERFKFLRRWVLPNESSDLLRTSGSFTPTHPAPPVLNHHPIDVATAEARQAFDSRCVQTGGNFVCPAILLVLAAAELDQLAELKQQVLEFPAASSLDMAHNRASMLGIIALLEDNPEEALLWVRETQAVAARHKAAPMYSRWGDVALASLAIHHPATRDAAFELLESLLRSHIQTGNPGTPEFSCFVNQLHGQCIYLRFGGEAEAFGTNPKTSQWRTVSQPRARTRGDGIPISSFDIVAGEMAQRGGHDFDAAYFQSPLLGNYEVNCRLSHFDFREAMLMAAGNANALKWTHNEVKLSHPRSAIKEFPLATPITPKVYQWHDYKIVVKDGHYTSFINGQKLYEEALPADHDPWVAVVGWAANSSRAVRDIVITGKPTIPRELKLIGTPDLRGWMVDYYATDWGQTPFEWKLAGDELTSPQVLDANFARDRRKVENIIRYHRPMLEDGEISYEFYYDPEVKIELPPSNYFSGLGAAAPKRTARGQALVHPALDRMVCLIESDGVKVHWLTDGRWDRTGLKAGNIDPATSQSGAGAKLPLKEGDWNLVKFATKGDRLTVELNGNPVFTREIEPTNLRHFGFFHYANESNVRVRNVRYRGDWPTELPGVDQQDLAGGPQKLAAIPDTDLPDSRRWDFTKSKFSLDDFRYHWDARVAKQVTPTEEGLRIVQPAGETKMQFVGVSPKLTIGGDFIATLDYEGLKAVPADEGWGSGLSFSAELDGSYSTGFEVRLEAKAQAKITRSVMSMYAPDRPNYFQSESIGEFPAAGRLRLQRHGAAVYYFTADSKSDNFRLLTQRPLGTHDIKYLTIQGDASDRVGGSEFLLKSLSIRAKKLTKAE
ncbi:MAG: tetratricopeptide repeat protein [Schlesneria sp.]|nr:tetratricopeptide repeat protein [Schlesneria sp.]